MKKRLPWLLASVLVLLSVGFYYFNVYSKSTAESQTLEVKVKKGDFLVSVNTSGELVSQSNVVIEGPMGMRSVGIYQVKIQDIIAEGTLVEAGDFVASLDKSDLTEKLKNAESELSRAESQFTQTELDSALTLREARERLFNLKFLVEERELTLQQSTYEPPATIKRAEIELIKAKRELEQAIESYQIKVSQSVAKMLEASAKLQVERNKVEQIKRVLKEFTITAPENGMLIYAREWGGRKVKAGSTISAWGPTVALLPDLSKMLSKTFVNEVDIQKVKLGQTVSIGFDAFPEKKLSGEVVSVANMGEQKPNSDAKVFLVEIKLNEQDSVLRPGMTTSNLINIQTITDVLFIPIEALQAEDSLSFVYVKKGFSIEKREVQTGMTNDNEIVVNLGLEEGETVLLSVPNQDVGQLKRLAVK
jgi:RND family efflux transporter MFP subunit